MKKRLGVIGFGKMGILHGALANSLQNMEIIAICEKSRLIRSSLKSFLPRVLVYDDHCKMIDKCGLDAVLIATPTFCHVDSALYSAEKGVAFFVEKPLALNYESALSVSNLVTMKNIPSQIGFSFRFCPTIAEGKKILDSEVIGKVTSIRAEMFIGDVLTTHSGWRYIPTLSGGGVLMDFGIHMIDLLVWYFGPVSSVLASMKKVYSCDVEDEMVAEIVFSSGLKALFETSWSRPEYRKASPRIIIVGEKGKLAVTDQTVDITSTAGTHHFTYPDLYKGDYIDIAGINYSLQMKAFARTLHGEDSGLSLLHGAYIQKIVDSMYRSASKGLSVEV